MTIYLDHAASTLLAPEVAAAMRPYLLTGGVNPASAHDPGRAAAAAVEMARGQAAAAIGAGPGDLLWTSGATEANNLAILGSAAFRTRPAHMVSVVTEHPSVREPLRALERRGWAVSWLEVDRDGRIDIDGLAAALRPDTVLVSIMAVNNETGVRQDLAAVAAQLEDRDVALHVDAAQGLVDVDAIGASLVSLSAHKMGGPQGVGALYVRRRPATRLAPLYYGGGQERGLRPGTVAVHLVVGMGQALALVAEQRLREQPRLAGLREALWQRLAATAGITRNGQAQHCAAHILNVSVAGVHGEALLAALSWGQPGLAVSSGSACASAAQTSSYVLRAMGRSSAEAAAGIRFSFGRTTCSSGIERAAERVVAEIERLRCMAPETLA
ncbi:MAG: cysteine desulfurase [Salinisphaera sp.]|nr:cysteine desulfurase [Salinisphaera sp.]